MSLPSPFWTERRDEHRVSGAIPIRFEWLTVGGELLRARGVTRDISDRGMYCYIEHPLAVGLQVGFDILYPAEPAGRESLMFRCQGWVLRCERLRNRFGVAVAIQFHQVLDTTNLYRRSYDRILLPSPVVAAYAGLHAVVRNLSRIGAFIEDHHPLPVGQKMELRLQAQEWKGEIVVQAIVRRVEPGVGMGVEFVALTSDADNQLRELVDKNTNPAEPR
ncbi:MAG: PilZ domain-containing protein [Acidobacteria bacterium]|nr:PilZ domain-containing protein [Acidobacteriota bacterium]